MLPMRVGIVSFFISIFLPMLDVVMCSLFSQACAVFDHVIAEKLRCAPSRDYPALVPRVKLGHPLPPCVRSLPNRRLAETHSAIAVPQRFSLSEGTGRHNMCIGRVAYFPKSIRCSDNHLAVPVSF